jgi:hypothetical protein
MECTWTEGHGLGFEETGCVRVSEGERSEKLKEKIGREIEMPSRGLGSEVGCCKVARQ